MIRNLSLNPESPPQQFPKCVTFYIVTYLVCCSESYATCKHCNEFQVRSDHTLFMYLAFAKPCSEVFLFLVILCSQEKIPSSHLSDWRRHTTTHPAHTPCQRQRKGRYVLIWTELWNDGGSSHMPFTHCYYCAGFESSTFWPATQLLLNLSDSREPEAAWDPKAPLWGHRWSVWIYRVVAGFHWLWIHFQQQLSLTRHGEHRT